MIARYSAGTPKPHGVGRLDGPRLRVRRVPAVQHELVPVGVGEDRHVADAGVEGVAEELDALGLEHGAHLSDVVAAQRPRVALLGDERHALLLGLPDPEARVAGPLLPLSVLVRAQPQDAAVEGAGALGVLGGDAEEVESFDDSHDGPRYDAEAPAPAFSRTSCSPSANSSIILALKAGRSSGLRLVTRPWSTTTSSSTQSPPALRMSVLIDGYEVSVRPLTAPASTRVHGAWQIAAIGLPALTKPWTNWIASGSVRRLSGLATPPGSIRPS